MVSRFLITGLPRSRTAWLAALCNTVAGAVCWHEPCARAASWQMACAAWYRASPRFIGLSDPTLAVHLGAILKDHAPRVLWIDRPVADVEASLARLGFGGTGIPATALEAATPFLGHALVTRVRFGALNDNEVVAWALTKLMPGAIPNRAVIAEFQRLNIQVQPSVARGEAAAQRAHLPAIFGAEFIARMRERVA